MSAIFLLLIGQIKAQEGQIVGTVKDPSGAVIPNVTVTATEAQTSFARTAVSNASGEYELRSLRPTTYTVSAETSGFKKVTESNVRLEANQSLSLNLTLELGQITESVNVEANAVQVDTSTSTIREVVDQSRIVELPLNGRNAAQLTTLIPGAVTNPGSGVDQGITKTFPSQPVISSNGGVGGTTSFQLDGNNNNDHYTQINQPFPAPDFLQEFSVQSSNYDAQYGSNAGAVVNAVTRSGTNQIHGARLNSCAMDISMRGIISPRRRTRLKRNQYGGSFGGPVVFPKLYNGRNRTFIFMGFQQSAIPQRASERHERICSHSRRAEWQLFHLRIGVRKALKDPLSAGGTGYLRGKHIPSADSIPVSLNVYQALPPATGAGLVTFGKGIS